MAAFDFKKIVADSTQAIKDGAQKAQNTIKNVDIKSSTNAILEKSKEATDALKKKTEDTIQHIQKMGEKRAVSSEGLLSAECALQLMMLVMSADGLVSDDELERLCEIGKELDPNFNSTKQSLVEYSNAIMPKCDTEDYQDILRDSARDIIAKPQKQAIIPVKLLIWDMLVIAFSDNSFDKSEEDLIRYISRHLKIDKSVMPEMENSIRALDAVENEIIWLKSTERKFSEVEKELNELADRKNAIMQGIHMLISE